MATFHIHITGCVQGVGFRPFVYNIAHHFGLQGTVSNGLDGVNIYVNCSARKAEQFLKTCLQQAPKQAKITHSKLREVEKAHFSTFSIVESSQCNTIDLALTPDFALCKVCRHELHDTKNTRYHYPFITCTHCGPRFSVVEALPYDRERTTMSKFKMCTNCTHEYHNIHDRRYFAQTNSCPSCGISMELVSPDGKKIKKQNVILEEVQSALSGGKVVAVKGIGGYLLLCDATQEEAVHTLRKRKYRARKPFAVLYPSIQKMKKDLELTPQAETLLTSSVAPITLLRLKEKILSELAKDAVAPELTHLGAMIPYAPILELIASKFEKPLVATSANLHGSPIVYKDEQAYSELFQFADFILSNNREITVPQDDSVVKLTPFLNSKIILRRSRGIAPSFYTNQKVDFHSENLIAMGAEMKGSFAVKERDNLYISQYLGSLTNYEAQQHYQATFKHFITLMQAAPQTLLVDKHPSYFTASFGKEISETETLSLEEVQHHKAHFAAVLGENDLLNLEEKVLGIIWDGLGYGDDQKLWGGEFFTYHQYAFERVGHLLYFPVLAGDKMAKSPRLSAFSLTGGNGYLQKRFTKKEWGFYHKLILKSESIKTSSMGRVFDAVAYMLELIEEIDYEGQTGLLLEQLAESYLAKNPYEKLEAYPFMIFQGEIILQSLFTEMIEDLEHKSKAYIAAKFHYTLVEMIREMAVQQNVKQLAFSGGVFQNGVLVDLIKIHLSEFQLYFHQQLSPNDENISYGQLMYHIISTKKKLLTNEYSFNTF